MIFPMNDGTLNVVFNVDAQVVEVFPVVAIETHRAWAFCSTHFEKFCDVDPRSKDGHMEEGNGVHKLVGKLRRCGAVGE